MFFLFCSLQDISSRIDTLVHHLDNMPLPTLRKPPNLPPTRIRPDFSLETIKEMIHYLKLEHEQKIVLRNPREIENLWMNMDAITVKVMRLGAPKLIQDVRYYQDLFPKNKLSSFFTKRLTKYLELFGSYRDLIAYRIRQEPSAEPWIVRPAQWSMLDSSWRPVFPYSACERILHNTVLWELFCKGLKHNDLPEMMSWVNRLAEQDNQQIITHTAQGHTHRINLTERYMAGFDVESGFIRCFPCIIKNEAKFMGYLRNPKEQRHKELIRLFIQEGPWVFTRSIPEPYNHTFHRSPHVLEIKYVSYFKAILQMIKAESDLVSNLYEKFLTDFDPILFLDYRPLPEKRKLALHQYATSWIAEQQHKREEGAWEVLEDDTCEWISEESIEQPESIDMALLEEMFLPYLMTRALEEAAPEEVLSPLHSPFFKRPKVANLMRASLMRQAIVAFTLNKTARYEDFIDLVAELYTDGYKIDFAPNAEGYPELLAINHMHNTTKPVASLIKNTPSLRGERTIYTAEERKDLSRLAWKLYELLTGETQQFALFRYCQEAIFDDA